MSLTKTVVGRPTTLIIVFVLLVGLGLYASLNLAIDLYPDIEPPVLMIFSNYEGAGPEEVEKSLTVSPKPTKVRVMRVGIEPVYSTLSTKVVPE